MHPSVGGDTWGRRAGALSVRPAEFAGLDEACAELLRAIARIRALAVEVGDHARWGLGEENARLISASTLVTRLRSAAGATENSIAAALDAHSRIVEDIRHSFREARDQIVCADDEWAGRLNSVESIAGQYIRSTTESL